ncbi:MULTISPECIES: WGR domain-containing protein [unclassified Bradyrhizobium]|uniref:WGR domain-containing protein n=1 Tax=unclassified Bradyrhizobium TaxID=2631580 RepID=UPI00244B62D4|nr:MULTISPECIES: WGR domain-containing protein [unclassified Bradyrhizobium]MDH2344195.1 WGR domain-containing protein [Bradyrhizobium sp. SSUT77]MDH2356874.1 WGR domain-containing protein [Bradyrhizobium sp. SSUT112]
MAAIMLTRIANRRNMARFYKQDVQPTLFDEGRFFENGAVWAPGGLALKVSRLKLVVDIVDC